MKKVNLKSGQILLVDNGIATRVVDKAGKTVDLIDRAVAGWLQSGLINDAEGAVAFSRQLEYVRARVYETKYPELKARQLFPVTSGTPVGAQSLTITSFDMTGIAKIISDYGQGLVRADAHGKQSTVNIRTMGAAYGYSIEEMEAAAYAGVPLSARKGMALNRSFELGVNEIAFYGDSNHNIGGFFSNPNIPTSAAAASGTGSSRLWADKTPDQILEDINNAFTDVFSSTNMVHSADTLVLSADRYAFIAAKPRGDGTDTTVLEYVVKASPFLNSMADVIPLNECAAANNPLLSTDCFFVYERREENVELHIPMELNQLPTQTKDMEFLIPARLTTAGLIVHYPLAFNLVTGI